MVYTTTGMYDEAFTNIYGCDSIITIDLTVSLVDTSVTVANCIYTAVGTGTYQWLDCTDGYQPIVGETNQTFTPTVNGVYALQITNGSCIDTSSCNAIDNVGLIYTGPAYFDNIYPNPTNGGLTITFSMTQESIRIEVMNIAGKIVSSDIYADTDKIKLDIIGADGVYFIHFLPEGSYRYVSKVIKGN